MEPSRNIPTFEMPLEYATLEASGPQEASHFVGHISAGPALEFLQVVDVSGLSITKLDGSARGGVVFNIAREFNIPIRFIGIGEKIDDLRPFNAEEYVEAIFDGVNTGL